MSVFLSMLWFSGSSAYAETSNQPEGSTAIMDRHMGRVHIYELNFGDEPTVRVTDDLLINNSFSDTFWQTALLTVLSLGHLIWLLPALSLTFVFIRRLLIRRLPLELRNPLAHKGTTGETKTLMPESV
jgi:hypothetical protein